MEGMLAPFVGAPSQDAILCFAHFWPWDAGTPISGLVCWDPQRKMQRVGIRAPGRCQLTTERGLTWRKHCPGAATTPVNSTESRWEGPEPALPVLHPPSRGSITISSRRPARVFPPTRASIQGSSEPKSLLGTASPPSLVPLFALPPVFQGALSKLLSHERSCHEAPFLRSQANPGTTRTLLLPQTFP